MTQLGFARKTTAQDRLTTRRFTATRMSMRQAVRHPAWQQPAGTSAWQRLTRQRASSIAKDLEYAKDDDRHHLLEWSKSSFTCQYVCNCKGKRVGSSRPWGRAKRGGLPWRSLLLAIRALLPRCPAWKLSSLWAYLASRCFLLGCSRAFTGFLPAFSKTWILVSVTSRSPLSLWALP